MMVLMAVMLNPFPLVEAKGLSLEEYGNNKPFGGKACGDASFCYFDEMFCNRRRHDSPPPACRRASKYSDDGVDAGDVETLPVV